MDIKIVLIEDDTFVGSALQAKLSVAGFKVSIFLEDQTESLLSRIKLNRPDYIILDLILATIDGLELLSAVKGHEETAVIPVLVFSKTGDKTVESRASELGAEHILGKRQFVIDDFVTTVGKVITNKEKVRAKNPSQK